jgi:hypothetical protein
MTNKPSTNSYGIRDNHHHGKVADFLVEKVSEGSELSVVSAYFTIYAYEALAEQLDQISSLRFLIGEPSFITSLDPDKTDKEVIQNRRRATGAFKPVLHMAYELHRLSALRWREFKGVFEVLNHLTASHATLPDTIFSA